MVVHHDDTDQSYRTDDVGTRTPTGQIHRVSSTSVVVSGRCRSTHDPRARVWVAGGHERHRRVHVRRLDQLQASTFVVERAAAVGERLDAVGGARTDHHQRAVAVGRSEAVAGAIACRDRGGVHHGRLEPQRRLVAVPERGAEPEPVAVRRREAARTPTARGGSPRRRARDRRRPTTVRSRLGAHDRHPRAADGSRPRRPAARSPVPWRRGPMPPPIPTHRRGELDDDVAGPRAECCDVLERPDGEDRTGVRRRFQGGREHDRGRTVGQAVELVDRPDRDRVGELGRDRRRGGGRPNP